MHKLCAIIFALSITIPIAGAAWADHPKGLLRSNQSSIKNWKGKKVRVEYAIVEIQNGKAMLSFEAASMDAKCNLGGTRSAWLQIQFTDSNKEPLGPFKQVWVASVSSRGGYEAHDNIGLHLTCTGRCSNERFSDTILFRHAHGFNMRMVGGVSC